MSSTKSIVRDIVVGLLVTLLGGVLVAWIIQDARFTKSTLPNSLPIQSPPHSLPAAETVQAHDILPRQLPSSSTQEIDGLKFHLTGCRGQASQVICSFTLTARSRDLIYRPGCVGSSRIYDEHGQEGRASEMTLANRHLTGMSEATLVRGVVTAGEYTFTGLGFDAQQVTLLRFRFCIDNRTRFAEFRNITIGR